MKTAQCSLDIARPPAALHDFMLDLQHAHEWGELISSMEWIDGTGPRAGARVRLHFWAEGRERTQEATLALWDHGRGHVMVNESEPGFHCTFSYRLEPIPTGTRLTITANVIGRTIGHKLMLPMLRRRHHDRFTRTLARLKTAAEKSR